MATTTKEENPKKILAADPKSAFDAEAAVEKAPPSTTDATAKVDTGGEELKAVNATGSGNSSDGGSPVNDTQKKIRRAERFGMPVQLSEVEKRNSRAERFGTGSGSGSGSHGASEATKKSEDLKRKARAERFGTAAAQSVPSVEEEKKKARLARFVPASITDSAEEHKKKARALRFSGSQVNGKDKIEQTTAIAGKAGGGT